MRYVYAVLVSVFLVGGAAAQQANKDPEQAGEPVYDDRGRIFGYVITTEDDLTDVECVPDDPRPYPLCFTFGDDSGADDGGEDGEDS